MPADVVIKAMHRDKAPYDQWIREGYIEVTPGNVVDYNYLEKAIMDDFAHYQALEVGYDPYNAEATMLNLQDEYGITVVKVPQVPKEQNWPMKTLQAAVISGKFRHGDNPVALWMADNLVAVPDKNLNVGPSKNKSISKIDGMSALVTALNRMQGQNNEAYQYSGLTGD